jgi:uncharacterized protein YndB with AHSA1/START domain
MSTLEHVMEREITIAARRDTVFRYFTDTPRFAKWWGEGSSIDARPGGEVTIRFPGAGGVSGKILEIDPPARIAFSYGYAGSDPEEFSRVDITLDEVPEGTHLHLRHAFSSAKIRDHHVQGWRYQLALFSKTVTEEQHAEVASRVDDFLRAWGDPDAAARRRLLEGCAAPGIVMLDAFSATSGLEDLLANLDAIQVFMPGLRLKRQGEVRLSHGSALAAWVIEKDDGTQMGAGSNVYDLSPDGKIARVVGFRQ